MNTQLLVDEYFAGGKHMQLATVSNGKPWICTVYYVLDDTGNIYWTSDRSSRHSREILADANAAATVVHDDKKKQAIQIAGSAFEVMDDDLERVHGLYVSKFGSKDYDLEKMKERSEFGRSYWVLKPEKISLWDTANFPDSPKQEVP